MTAGNLEEEKNESVKARRFCGRVIRTAVLLEGMAEFLGDGQRKQSRTSLFRWRRVRIKAIGNDILYYI